MWAILAKFCTINRMLYYRFANKSHSSRFFFRGENESIETNKQQIHATKFLCSVFRLFLGSFAEPLYRRAVWWNPMQLLCYNFKTNRFSFFGSLSLIPIVVWSVLCFVMSASSVWQVVCECDTKHTRVGSLPSFPSLKSHVQMLLNQFKTFFRL